MMRDWGHVPSPCPLPQAHTPCLFLPCFICRHQCISSNADCYVADRQETTISQNCILVPYVVVVVDKDPFYFLLFSITKQVRKKIRSVSSGATKLKLNFKKPRYCLLGLKYIFTIFITNWSKISGVECHSRGARLTSGDHNICFGWAIKVDENNGYNINIYRLTLRR